MSDRKHLEELLAQVSNNLSKHLLEQFREMVRRPDVSTSEYAGKLRALMDEQLQASNNAPD